MQGQQLPSASMPWGLAPDAPHVRSHAHDGGPLAAPASPDDELGTFQFDPASSRALAQDQRRAQNNGSPLILHVPPPVGTAAPHHSTHHRYVPSYTGAQLPPPAVHTETPQKSRGTVMSHHHGGGSSYMISAAGSDASPVSAAMETSMYSSSFHHPQQQQQGGGGLTTTDPFMDSTMSISQVLPFDPTAVGAPTSVVAVSTSSPPSGAPSLPLAPAPSTTHTIHYIELPPGAVPPGGMLHPSLAGPPTHHGLPPGTVTTTVYHHGPAPAFYPQLPSGMMPPMGPGNTVVIHSSAPSPPQAGPTPPPPSSMGQPRMRTPASGAASRMQGASPSAGMPAFRTQTATPTSVPRATPNVEIESPPTQLIVNYLSPRVTEPELRQIFEQFGPIEVCRVIYDKPSGAAKGYGFVYYFHAVDASRAVASMNGFEMYGKWLKVSFAVPQRRKDPQTGLYESGPQASSHS